MKNIIILSRNNEVEIAFTFTGDFAENGLSNFTNIQLTIGGETYTTTSNPSELYLNGNNALVLNIGSVTALAVGSYKPEIIGFSATYPDGFVLACDSVSKIGLIYVREC